MRWKRARRSGLSVGRIVLVAMLLATVAIYGLQRLRPLPLPWHAIGAERIDTPAFDIADERTRMIMKWLSGDGLNNQGRRWLGASCELDFGAADEVYVLSDSGSSYSLTPQDPYRVVVVLGSDRKVVYERFSRMPDRQILERRSRIFGVADADRFRSLLIDGDYPEMTPYGSYRTDSATVTLESCINGRYYGVMRIGGTDGPSLYSLAGQIRQFALGDAAP